MKNKLYILLFMQLLFTANSVAQKIGQETTQETTQEVHQKNCDCNYITSGYYQDMNNAQIEFIRGNNEKAYQYLRQAEKKCPMKNMKGYSLNDFIEDDFFEQNTWKNNK